MQKFKQLWDEIYAQSQEKKTDLINAITAEGFIEVKEAIEVLKGVGKWDVGLSDANDILTRIFKETTDAAPTLAEGIE